MASPADTLKWSVQLNVAASNKRLVGDKIILPQSALEGLLAAAPVVTLENGDSRNLTSNFDPFNPYSYAAERHAREALADRQQQLPHPLTFRIVNPSNGHAIYAGIREFSADENEVQLSGFLRETLGLHQHAASHMSTREGTPNGDVAMTDAGNGKVEVVTIHAKQLPKGTYVRLRPLEAGYDPEDWKSLLERYLRENFTTLTMNEVLEVPGARHEHFKFLVDKFEPEGEGICVVDTDLEVDIEALSEEQAKETLSRRLAKAKRAPGTNQGSSTGGLLQVSQEVHGQILPGDYVDYELKEWDRTADLKISLTTESDFALDLLASPMSARQRAKPREDEHVFSDLTSRPTKRLKLSHRYVDIEEAESVSIAVYAWSGAILEESASLIPYTISIRAGLSSPTTEADQDSELVADEVICKNCRQHIPKRTSHLHEAFCYRNNILCSKCSEIFLKNSAAWKSHWHCPHDDDFGSGETARAKHHSMFHPSEPLKCPNCDFQAFDLPILAQHRTSTCPGKEILCQFCHLVVSQQGPDDPSFTDAEVLLSGLTPHELADGARTTECHICNKIVRLRDMKTHLGLHDRERLSRPKPMVCINGICGRTIKAGDEARVHKEQLSLCSECFSPLYGTGYDPENKVLRRRAERRLLQQVVGGCGKPWCQNANWCKTGQKNSTGDDRVLTAREALPMIKPILDQLKEGHFSNLRFCVDETTQSGRLLAGILAQDGQYEVEWYIKALEESKNNVSAAQEWLSTHAPRTNEIVG